MTAGTVVGRSATERVLVAVLLPVLGVAAAEAVNLLAPTIAGLPWAPLQGPFRLIARLPEPHTTVGAMVVGLVAGLVLVAIAAAEAVTVRVSDDDLAITRDDATTTVRRDQVSAVYLAGRDLVVLGTRTEELARQRVELSAGRLRAAFTRHGYPWRADGDPHAEAYRRWVPGLPELPDAADPLFRARARALDRKHGDDADELRGELGRLGVVVADRDGRQYFRQCPAPDRADG